MRHRRTGPCLHSNLPRPQHRAGHASAGYSCALGGSTGRDRCFVVFRASVCRSACGCSRQSTGSHIRNVGRTRSAVCPASSRRGLLRRVRQNRQAELRHRGWPLRAARQVARPVVGALCVALVNVG